MGGGYRDVLNRIGKVYRYDAAGRNTQALEFRGEPPADLATLDGESFRYDTADNLIERSTKTFGIEQKTSLPRPSRVQKGPFRYTSTGTPKPVQ